MQEEERDAHNTISSGSLGWDLDLELERVEVASSNDRPDDVEVGSVVVREGVLAGWEGEARTKRGDKDQLVCFLVSRSKTRRLSLVTLACAESDGRM